MSHEMTCPPGHEPHLNILCACTLKELSPLFDNWHTERLQPSKKI